MLYATDRVVPACLRQTRNHIKGCNKSPHARHWHRMAQISTKTQNWYIDTSFEISCEFRPLFGISLIAAFITAKCLSKGDDMKKIIFLLSALIVFCVFASLPPVLRGTWNDLYENLFFAISVWLGLVSVAIVLAIEEWLNPPWLRKK